MPTGRAGRASVLTSALLETGVWRKSTAFRQLPKLEGKRQKAEVILREALIGFCILPSDFSPSFRARSSKRAGGLIPRIALDQCRVPERYRTRAPAFARRASARQAILARKH